MVQTLLSGFKRKGKHSCYRDSFSASFFEVELLKLSDVETYFEKEPGLKRYKRFIQDIYRLKPYTLSMEKEELLAGCQDIFLVVKEHFIF